MATLTNKSLATPDVIRNLGMRIRDYRLRLRLTRKEVYEAASIGMYRSIHRKFTNVR